MSSAVSSFVCVCVCVAAAAATADLSDEEKSDIGLLKETLARALFWTQQVINAPLKNGVCALVDYVLPVPPAVTSLLFAVGCLVNIAPDSMKDPCKDISWDAVKKVCLSHVISLLLAYNVMCYYVPLFC